MLQAKTEEQKKWVEEFINSLPYFDKERRFSPCLYCSDVTNDGISIVRKYSEGSGWDEKSRSVTTYISFDNIEQIVDHLRSVNKPKKSLLLDLSIVAPNMLEPVETWLAYKREKGQTYKQKGFSVFYKRLLQISDNNPEIAKIIIEKSMACNYSGIFPLKDEEKKSIQTPAAEMTIKEKFENFLKWLHAKRGDRAMMSYRITMNDFCEMIKAYPSSATLCLIVLNITEQPIEPNEKLIDVFRRYRNAHP